MARINSVKTDLKKEDEGVWVDFVLGIRLKIARSRNSAYSKLIKVLTEPHLKNIREANIKLEALEDILKQVRARTILVDWKNIEDDTGSSIGYSPEQALEFFEDPELRDFYNFVVTISEDMENFKKELVEDSEKNLPSSSDGSSNGGDIKES